MNIPAGTRIYLKKNSYEKLYIRPDRTVEDNSLYVAYDVRIDGETVIPRGTRVSGEWISQSSQCCKTGYIDLVAQLQTTRIYLSGSGQTFLADSDVYNTTDEFNSQEIQNSNHLYGRRPRVSSSNIMRRSVSFNSRVRTLSDNDLDTPYLEINTSEIPVTLQVDFIPFLCL